MAKKWAASEEPKKILICDDYGGVLRDAVKELAPLRYEIVTAIAQNPWGKPPDIKHMFEDIDEFEGIVRAEQPDFIVSDSQMELETDGAGFTTAMRERGLDIPTVIFTNANDIELDGIKARASKIPGSEVGVVRDKDFSVLRQHIKSALSGGINTPG